MSLKKTAPVEAPHAIYANDRAGFEWRVLKTYKVPASEAKDQYARWFLGTRSPYTYGSHELGDGYVRDIVGHARLVAASLEWLEAYGISGDEALALPSPEEYIAQQQAA